MTTIERVYGRLRELMTDDFEKVSSRQYKAASDPFSFDLQPRSDFDAWYVDGCGSSSLAAQSVSPAAARQEAIGSVKAW